MPASLSSALFREVRPEFFRVLAGQKTGRLYVDALDALERVTARRVQGIERDDAVALVEEAVEAHADVPLDEGDPGSAALSTREKARAVLDTLRRAGWLEDEERSDWQKLVHFHPSGQVLMQTLRRLSFPEGVVFSDKLVSVCTTLARHDATNDPLRLEPWQHVESSVAALQEGIAELRGMQTAIERHTRQQLAAATLKENLAVLFDQFAERIGHACYAELVRARLPLRLGEARWRVEELASDAELLGKMQAEVLRREPALSPETAMSRVRLRLEELAELLQSVVPVADAVDRRTAEFTRRSLARFRYLQETTSENRCRKQGRLRTGKLEATDSCLVAILRWRRAGVLRRAPPGTFSQKAMHHERVYQTFRCMTEDLRKCSNDAKAVPFPEGDSRFVGADDDIELHGGKT